jgi:SM-20-related protein
MDHEERQEHDQFEALIQGLIDDNYGCCDDFILPSTVIGLSDNIRRLNESGDMKTSGIGNNEVFHKDNKFRGDKINWIEGESKDPFELIYLKKIEKFIAHLNRSCYTSLKSFESHYAHYEKGRFYKRHLDQFKDEKGRQFSIILYLNEDWKEEDGGILSLYPEGREPKKIAPKGGRMVFFRSDEMEHEVHPSHTRNRSSIAGWLKR